jgi:hypothetical protein
VRLKRRLLSLQRWCIPKCLFFLPRGEKLVWRIFFLHFISRIFIARALLLLAYKKQTLPLVGWSKKYLSINYCDFLTPTD